MFNISSRTPMYDQNAVQPMRDELKAVGFTELLNAKEVDEAIKQNNNETVLVMINS
ncbi:MAG: BrxA/BrxB family bacilliredoxin, partial [Ignavibacteria bacterium]|nr:BrxA/BrxB family bacilliredoxin [Ignavibacteria bacterium]